MAETLELKLPIIEDEHELVRSELNFEQYPIFTVSRSGKKSRQIVRTQKETNGTIFERRVTIGRTEQGHEVGVLTAFDAKVFYALQYFWDQEGRPVNKPIVVTLYRLAKYLGMKTSGAEYKQMKRALFHLVEVPITWYASFYHPDKNEYEEFISAQRILIRLDLKAKRRGENTRAAFAYQLDERIQRNLLANYSHPILINTVLSLNKEYAQLLYPYIDRRLAHTKRFEATLTNLWQTLDFSSEGIRYPADRKVKITSAFKELIGKPLSTGTLIDIRIEKTADGEDYKAIFIKGARANALTPKGSKIDQPKPKATTQAKLKPINPPEHAQYLANEMLRQLGDSQSVQFYKKIATYCPDNLIFRLLSETKDAYLQGEIKSKPKIFVTKLKEHMPHLFKLSKECSAEAS
jgi:hypothetical protein